MREYKWPNDGTEPDILLLAEVGEPLQIKVSSLLQPLRDTIEAAALLGYAAGTEDALKLVERKLEVAVADTLGESDADQ